MFRTIPQMFPGFTLKVFFFVNLCTVLILQLSIQRAFKSLKHLVLQLIFFKADSLV